MEETMVEVKIPINVYDLRCKYCNYYFCLFFLSEELDELGRLEKVELWEQNAHYCPSCGKDLREKKKGE